MLVYCAKVKFNQLPPGCALGYWFCLSRFSVGFFYGHLLILDLFLSKCICKHSACLLFFYAKSIKGWIMAGRFFWELFFKCVRVRWNIILGKEFPSMEQLFYLITLFTYSFNSSILFHLIILVIFSHLYFLKIRKNS